VYYKKEMHIECRGELSKETTARQWADPKHRKLVSEKVSKKNIEQYKNGERDRNVTANGRAVIASLYGAGGYLGVVRGTKSFQKKINKGVVRNWGSRLEMLKKTTFKALGKASWAGSSLERALKGHLDSMGIKYVQQYWVGKRRVDFYVPEWKTFLEADSLAHHSDVEKERKRDLEILLQKPDHKITHVMYGQNHPTWTTFDLYSLNHAKAYQFSELRVKEIVKIPKQKRKSWLYNLAVDEDESYVTMSGVVHNCRCVVIVHPTKVK
jgi:hypothetical protein